MDLTETGMGKGEWEIENGNFLLLLIGNATYFSKSDYRYLNFFSYLDTPSIPLKGNSSEKKV